MVKLIIAYAIVVCAMSATHAQGRTNDNSLTLVITADQNGNDLPNWGDSIAFYVVAPDGWDQIQVKCTQDDVVVYGGVIGRLYNPNPLTLRSTMWTGGAAECVATLQSFNTKGHKSVLAELAFAVEE